MLFFFSSTVNPILYNVMSKKYRVAFKSTLCCCFHKTGVTIASRFYNSERIMHSQRTLLSSSLTDHGNSKKAYSNPAVPTLKGSEKDKESNLESLLDKKCDTCQRDKNSSTVNANGATFTTNGVNGCKKPLSPVPEERQIKGDKKSSLKRINGTYV